MNKKNIYFKADEQLLTNITPNCFASDTVAYIEAHFDLGENWSGFDSVRAVWTNGAAVISSVLYDGACIVPWEVLTKRAEVKVNLVGSNVENGELIDRLTTCQVPALNIKCKALIEGSNTATPTPSEYEQFVQNVHEDAERAEAARDEAEQILTDTEQIKTDVENLKTQTLAIKVETESIKGDVETLKSQTEDLVDGFNDEVEEALDRISAKEDDVLYDINSAKTSALGEINDKETLALAEIVNAKSSALTDISSARVTTLTEIQTEGTTQKNIVTTEGQTQVANVQTEGETQIQAIEDKGAEVIASIPNFAPVITDTAEGSIASFSDGADDYPMVSVVAEIVPIQEGSGDPSPTNVRPISGWDGVEVEVVGGANILNVDLLTEDAGNYILNDSGVQIADAQSSYYLARISVKPNTEYYFIGGATTNGIQRIYFFDASDNFISRTGAFNSPRTWVTPQNCSYIRIQFKRDSLNKDTWGINYPSTDTSYHPYQGSSYSIPFKDENGDPITVYGGEIDVVSGEGVDPKGYKLFDGSTPCYDVTTNFADGYNRALYMTLRDVAKADQNTRIESNIFKYTDASVLGLYKANINGNGILCIGVPLAITTPEEMQAWAEQNPFQIVYELATPTPIYCEPTEIKTLKGNNNIWADTGDVSVEYPADTKLYIDKKING